MRANAQFRFSALCSSPWCAQPSFGAAVVQYSCTNTCICVSRSVRVQLQVMSTTELDFNAAEGTEWIVLLRPKGVTKAKEKYFKTECKPVDRHINGNPMILYFKFKLQLQFRSNKISVVYV